MSWKESKWAQMSLNELKFLQNFYQWSIPVQDMCYSFQASTRNFENKDKKALLWPIFIRLFRLKLSDNLRFIAEFGFHFRDLQKLVQQSFWVYIA